MLFKRQKYTWHMSYMQNYYLLYLRLWCLLIGRGKIKGQSISKSVSLKEADYFIYVDKAALSCLQNFIICKICSVKSLHWQFSFLFSINNDLLTLLSFQKTNVDIWILLFILVLPFSFFSFKICSFLFYMYKCLACMCMHCLQRAESTGSLWTGVKDGCEPPYRCWESNFNPLEE